MEGKIEEFIKRRFPTDCNWTSENSYFFALILQSAFGGEIYYDVMNKHFLLQHGRFFYDWTGKVVDYDILVKWADFEQYDKIEKEQVIRSYIM